MVIVIRKEKEKKIHEQDWEKKKHKTKDSRKSDKIINEYCVQLKAINLTTQTKWSIFLEKMDISKTG